MSSNDGKNRGFFDDEDYVQPIDPPKVKYVGPYASGQNIPEEYRRIFGSPPPKGSKKPVPPPPLPPNSYHKKPKYWQSRASGHMSQHNRIALVMAGVLGSVAIGFHVLGQGSLDRLNTRLGIDMSPEAVEERERHTKFHWQMISDQLPMDALDSSIMGDKYHNPRRHDKTLRWDIREMDKEIRYARYMENPLDADI